MKIWDFLPDAEKVRDTDGHLKKFIKVFDETIADFKQYCDEMLTRNPDNALSSNLDLLASHRSIESFDVDDKTKRTLFRHAAPILRHKGNPNTLRFLFHLIIGYDVVVSIYYAKKLDVSGDPHSVGYNPNNALMDQNIGTANDIAAYGYDPSYTHTKVTYEIQNFDGRDRKLEVMEYLIKKYSLPINYEIITV